MGFLSGITKTIGGLVSSITGGDLIGLGAGLLSDSSQRDANDQNVALQRELAGSSIRMRVEDAKAAGIHPLYALGAQPYSASPSYVGTTGVANALSNMGQNMSRAAKTTSTADERFTQLQLENMDLQNDLLRSQITTINRTNSPPFPGSATVLPGQGNAPSRERASLPDVSFADTEQGGLAPIPSDAVKQRIEDNLPMEIEWYLRNRLNPWALLYGSGPSPREGYRWDATRQQYMPESKHHYPGLSRFIDKHYWKRR